MKRILPYACKHLAVEEQVHRYLWAKIIPFSLRSLFWQSLAAAQASLWQKTVSPLRMRPTVHSLPQVGSVIVGIVEVVLLNSAYSKVVHYEGSMWNSIRLCTLSDTYLPMKSFSLVPCEGTEPLRRGGGVEDCRHVARRNLWVQHHSKWHWRKWLDPWGKGEIRRKVKGEDILLFLHPLVTFLHVLAMQHFAVG